MEKARGKIRDAYSAMVTWFQNLKREKKPEDVPENGDAELSTEEDVEKNGENRNDGEPARFEYKPEKLMHRLFVGMGLKSKLAASRNVEIEYRLRLKWALVGVIAVLTVFLTPSLLPKWLGYRWSEPSDLCKGRSEKLARIQEKMESLARLEDGARFVEQATRALSCANNSAKAVWRGPPDRIRYPDQCIPENAKEKTRSHTECQPEKPITKRVCVNKVLKALFGSRLTCKTETIQPVCTTVVVPDQSSVRRVAELKARQKARADEVKKNVTNEFDVIEGTADEKAQHVIRRLVWQTEVASNLYIVYAMLAIIIGAPLVIYKRDLKTSATRRTLAMRKMQFVALVVLALVIYDYCESLLRDVDFPRLFRDFQNDPCYLDPSFSRKRLELIGNTCGNVTEQRANLDATLARMSEVVFDSELCEVCGVGSIQPYEDKKLVRNLKNELDKYNEGTAKEYVYPGVCNTTQLDVETATPPDSGISFARAFFGSGVIAQLFLKGILISFLIHGCAYMYDAMVLHKGQVEMFGIAPGTREGLSSEEEKSVRNFARDKHLLGFIIVSILMVWEVAVIGYSIYESHRKSGNLLTEVIVAEEAVERWVYSCRRGSLTSRNVTTA